jgi:hypothetical protein
LPGLTGQRGRNGLPGLIGENGESGSAGQQGPTGLKGRRGEDVAVDLGYVFARLIATLKLKFSISKIIECSVK